MKALVLAGVVLVAVVVSMIPSERAFAQGIDDFLAGDASCNSNPNSEQCICARVRAFGNYPQFVKDPITGHLIPEDIDGDGYHPVFNVDRGGWQAGEHEELDEPVPPVTRAAPNDLFFSADDDYGQNCALSYFRENLGASGILPRLLVGALLQ